MKLASKSLDVVDNAISGTRGLERATRNPGRGEDRDRDRGLYVPRLAASDVSFGRTMYFEYSSYNTIK